MTATPKKSLLGIEIGGTKIQMVAGDAGGHIVMRERFAVDRTYGGAGIRAEIEKIWRRLREHSPITAVGVGFGGPIDIRTGRIVLSNHIAGWQDFPLRDWLSDLTGGLPVAVENDANTAALAEACMGAGREFDKVFYVTLGSGMGGGMVLGRKLYHGIAPGEAEVGLMRYSSAGENFEAHCSGWAVDNNIRAAVVQNPDSLLAQTTRGLADGEAGRLYSAVAAGCPVARSIFERLTDDLAFAFSHVVHLFHPEVIVIGGGLSLIGEPLRAGVAEKLPGQLAVGFEPGPAVRLAALGEDVVTTGALLLAHNIVRSQ